MAIMKTQSNAQAIVAKRQEIEKAFAVLADYCDTRFTPREVQETRTERLMSERPAVLVIS